MDRQRFVGRALGVAGAVVVTAGLIVPGGAAAKAHLAERTEKPAATDGDRAGKPDGSTTSATAPPAVSPNPLSPPVSAHGEVPQESRRLGAAVLDPEPAPDPGNSTRTLLVLAGVALLLGSLALALSDPAVARATAGVRRAPAARPAVSNRQRRRERLQRQGRLPR